jgi:hypothetical protein
MALKQCEAPFPDESSNGSHEAHAASPQAAEAMRFSAATTQPAADDVRQHAEAPGTPAESNPSAAQLSANRSNARHSTGPRTPEGKARVAQNARKHGLFARDAMEMLEDKPEEQEEYRELVANLIADCAPGDRREREMVQRLASLIWRLAMLNQKMLRHLNAPYDGYASHLQVKYWDVLGRVEARTSREMMQIDRHIAFLQRYRLDRRARIQKLDTEIEERMESARRSEADMLRLQLAVGRMNGTLPPLGEEPAGADTVNPDPAPSVEAPAPAEHAAEAQPASVNPVELAAWKTYNEQPRKKRATKQTQSRDGETAGEPPKPDDGSNDLT